MIFDFNGTAVAANTLINDLLGQEVDNQAPIINAIQDDLNLDEKAPWSYQLSNTLFSDPDGDSLTYRVVMMDGSELPAWLSFDAHTLTLSGVAGNDDVGDLALKIIATDPKGLSAEQGFTVTVNNINDAPIVVGTLEDKVLTEGDQFTWTMPDDLFTDMDKGDRLSYSITLADGSKLPSWLSFDAATGVLSGTVPEGANGVLSLKVTATDLAGATASIDFGVTIEELVIENQAPIIGAIQGDLNLDEKAVWSYQLSNTLFSDPDGDLLTYRVVMMDGSELPAWLSFDANTRTLSGTAGNNDVGDLALKIIATDPKGLSVEQGFTVTVNNINDAPIVVGTLEDKVLTEGDQFTWTMPNDLFTDIDKGDQLSYSITLADGSKLPSWLSFDAATGVLSGTVPEGANGVLSLKVTATDLAGATASIDFGVTIEELVIENQAPIIGAIQGDLNLDEKAVWSYQLSNTLFSDPDGDLLTYRVVMMDGSELPAWLSFDANTRTLSGTAGNNDVGDLALKIIATDPKGLSVEQGFTVTVNNINDAPIAQGEENFCTQKAIIGEQWQFMLPENSFVDIDKDDQLTYSLRMADGSKVPDWLSIDIHTGTIKGIPTNYNVYDLVIVATDIAGEEATHSLTVGSVANNKDHLIIGSSASEQLLGGIGNNILYAMGGADELVGGQGNNTYVMSLKAGSHLTINNYSANPDAQHDILVFDIAVQTTNGSAGTQALMSFGRRGNDYVISYQVHGVQQASTVTIKNFYLGDAYKIDEFHFSNAVWKTSDLGANGLPSNPGGGVVDPMDPDDPMNPDEPMLPSGPLDPEDFDSMAPSSSFVYRTLDRQSMAEQYVHEQAREVQSLISAMASFGSNDGTSSDLLGTNTTQERDLATLVTTSIY